ncbi:hypothetical protein OG562_42530 [Streptomyces sp. NBC_01275]|uniref:hypothetical protein n=1 Tax=Streptomyces sp. NBC_01275 TaxID=2903807 RepID=UPI00225ADE67|nr:hypothetical protein [Streptomyces sp. NBC_01275]MCX4767517.1 hypothetical protein [Streptomyces sp. NBC_01275]
MSTSGEPGTGGHGGRDGHGGRGGQDGQDGGTTQDDWAVFWTAVRTDCRRRAGVAFSATRSWAPAALMAVLCVTAVHIAAGRLGHEEPAAGARAGGTGTRWESAVRAPHLLRTLTTRADFTVDPGSWQASVRHTLVLRPDDPLLNPIREGDTAATAEYLDDRLAGDVRYVAGEGFRTDGGTDRRLVAPDVNQDGPTAPAVVTWTLEETCRRPCAWDGDFRFTVRPTTDPRPTATRWTLEVRAHGTDVGIAGITGARPVRQDTAYAVLAPLGRPGPVSVVFRAADTRTQGFLREPSAETGPRFTPSFTEPMPVVLGIVLGFLLIVLGAGYGLRSFDRLTPRERPAVSTPLWMFTLISILLAVVAWEAPRVTDGAARSALATVLITWWGVAVPVGLLFLLPALHNVLKKPEDSDQKILHPGTFLALCVVTALGVGMEVALVIAYGSGGAPLPESFLGLVAAVLTAAAVPLVAPVAFNRPRIWSAVGAVAAVAACVVTGWGRLIGSDGVPSHTSEGLLLIGLGLLWAPALARATLLAGGRGRYWLCAALATGLLMYLPADVTRAFGTVRTVLASTPHPRLFEAALVDIAFHAAGAFMVVAIAVMVHRRWHQPRQLPRLADHAQTMRTERAAALGVAFVVLTVNPVVAAQHSNVTDVLPVAAALVGFSLLLRGAARRDEGTRLAGLDESAHADVVRAYARWALLQSVQPQILQKARDALIGEPPSPTRFEETWSRLGRGEAPPPLATGGGRTPWQNGVDAAVVAFVLALPVMAIEWYSVRKLLPELTLGQLLALAEHTLRWSAYGAFFGYFSTRLPGRTPVMKGQFLLAVLLVPELLLLFYPYSRQVTNLGLASGLRIGWLIVFCLVLGMYWEWRLVSRARVQWRLVRSFRSWASLTAPVTAVVVAAATAIATVLAGAAAVAMTQQPTEGTLQQQSSYSSSP